MNSPEIRPAPLEDRAEATLVLSLFLDKMHEKEHAEDIHDVESARILKEQCDELFLRVVELDPEFLINGDVEEEKLSQVLRDYSDKLTKDLHAKKN